MWICDKCKRIFEKTNQPHSCHRIPLEEHFKNKEKARELFDYLVETINEKVGKCQIVSLPCCIHLFGKYDFLAILPKKERLEIRFGLDRKIDSSKLIQAIPVSTRSLKNCIEIGSVEEVDEELIKWLNESYKSKN
jgi:hypothetical protein